MSLLDDVSIVVTPNGYKAGELYAVIPVPTLGTEELTCGNFECAVPTDYWTEGIGWDFIGGTANCDGTQTALSFLQQNGQVENGKMYQVTFDVVSITAGEIIAFLGGSQGTTRTLADTYTENFTATNSNFWLRASADFIGSIDNISVKEYTSADMDVTRETAATRVDENGLVNYAEVLGSEEVPSITGIVNAGGGTITQISGNSYSSTSDGTSSSSIRPKIDLATTAGKRYKLIITPTGTTSGTVKFKFYDGSNYLFENYDFTTTKEIYFVDNGSVFGTFDGTQTYDVSSFTVSVKEVTRDNVPRIDYTGGGCPHILAEPQRTNLVTYSEDFSQSFWNQTTATVTVTTNTNPSGTSGTYSVENVGSGSQLGASFSITSGNDYTASWYVRNISGTGAIIIKDTNNSTNNFTATSEWQRFSVTANASSGTGRCYMQVASGEKVEVWAAQFEEGSYATSYIPNFGTALGVTRNQDIFTRDGIGSLINDSEGVLFVEMAALSDDETNREITLSDGTGSNYVLIRFNSGGSNRIYTRVDVGGGNEYYDLDTSHTITDVNKIAIRWDDSNFATFINGVKVGSQLSGSSFSADTLNELNFDNGTGGSNFYGKVKQLQVYDTALTDTQLAALTS